MHNRPRASVFAAPSRITPLAMVVTRTKTVRFLLLLRRGRARSQEQGCTQIRIEKGLLGGASCWQAKLFFRVPRRCKLCSLCFLTIPASIAAYCISELVLYHIGLKVPTAHTHHAASGGPCGRTARWRAAVALRAASGGPCGRLGLRRRL